MIRRWLERRVQQEARLAAIVAERDRLVRARDRITADEVAVLEQLRACVAPREPLTPYLRQAVLIAQLGGVANETLEALLHLAAAGQSTPGSTHALERVGINLEPWPDAGAFTTHLRNLITAAVDHHDAAAQPADVTAGAIVRTILAHRTCEFCADRRQGRS